jgi:hypothetical protein
MATPLNAYTFFTPKYFALTYFSPYFPPVDPITDSERDKVEFSLVLNRVMESGLTINRTVEITVER